MLYLYVLVAGLLYLIMRRMFWKHQLGLINSDADAYRWVEILRKEYSLGWSIRRAEFWFSPSPLAASFDDLKKRVQRANQTDVKARFFFERIIDNNENKEIAISALILLAACISKRSKDKVISIAKDPSSRLFEDALRSLYFNLDRSLAEIIMENHFVNGGANKDKVKLVRERILH